jgi:raffinose/stachyose/melibiose transport system permease protein
MEARRIIRKVLRDLVVLILCIIEVYPLFWMLTASFKTPAEWTAKPAYALNDGFYLKNYVDAWTRGKMNIFFMNSFVNTIISLVFIVILSTTISFAISKMEWKWKKWVDRYFDIGIMVPVSVALIPLFQIYRKLGLYNTRASLILAYIAFGLSLSIYLMKSFLRSLPNEVMEAAVIDGCDIYQLLWHIVVPMMKNAIVTVLVLQFFFKWNDLVFSMTFVSDTRLKTIQTGLLYFSDEFGSKNWGAIFASISLSVFPLLILYMFMNKMVIEGMAVGAVKG